MREGMQVTSMFSTFLGRNCSVVGIGFRRVNRRLGFTTTRNFDENGLV